MLKLFIQQTFGENKDLFIQISWNKLKYLILKYVYKLCERILKMYMNHCKIIKGKLFKIKLFSGLLDVRC